MHEVRTIDAPAADESVPRGQSKAKLRIPRDREAGERDFRVRFGRGTVNGVTTIRPIDGGGMSAPAPTRVQCAET